MKTEVGTLIKPDGSKEIVRPHDGKKFSLVELQGFVDGPIELVHMKTGNGRGTMYVNENGKIEALAINMEATKIAAIFPNDLIVGPAIIVRKEERP